MQNKSYRSQLELNDSNTATKYDDIRLFLPISVCCALFLSISMVVADEVPSFDVTPTCRAGENIGADMRATFAACMRTEMEARDKLKAQWMRFTKDDKEHCLRACNCGGLDPSYVELLSCLELASDPSLEKNKNRR